MTCWTIIAAGGHGTRLAVQGGRPKQFLTRQGLPLYWHAALPFVRCARVQGVVFVFPEDFFDQARRDLTEHMWRDAPNLAWSIVPGGATRQGSVARGLAALPPDCSHVLIHDAARPFVRPELITRVLDALGSGDGAPAAVIPGIPVTDTIKEVDTAGLVCATCERAALRAVQTPQGFRLDALRDAHERAARCAWDVTDDAALMEKCGHDVLVVPGDEGNRKITTPADLALLRETQSPDPAVNGTSCKEPGMTSPEYLPCTGFGYDVHSYGGTRPFVIGGVPIATDITVSAHSDGDTLLHALTDALLGCLGQGDIGELFPDTSPETDNLPSGVMLAEALRRISMAGIILCHADCTIVAQAPKIAAHREHIRRTIATLLGLSPECVGLKATTEEKMGFTGEKRGIKAYAVVSGLRKNTASLSV